MLQNRFVKIMLLAGLGFGIFFAVGSGLTALFQHYTAADSPTSQEVVASSTEGERTNILLLGVDARPGEEHSRSDSMILLSIDPELDKVAVVSIPRDTKVEGQGTGMDKICAANYAGGPKAAVKLVEDIMDTNIDYYVEMDFKGFKNIVDTLGGVTINVPCRMYKPAEDIDLKPGIQRLNGRNALAFVRYRGYIQGDIQRTAMQQEFIKALADEMLQAKTITRLPRLIKDINQYVNTDMQVSDALRLASWAPGFDSDSIIAQTLPGKFYDVRDENGNLTASYWMANRSQASDLLDQMFSGQTVAVVEGSSTISPEASGIATPDSETDPVPTSTNKHTRNLDQERSSLPSPGHGSGSIVPATPVVPPKPNGPEGYI